MLAAAFLALALTAPPEHVSADVEREAQELARLSAREFDLGHAEEALRDIEHAYLLDPLPGLLFNLGQCHRKLKHWEQAELAYRSYLHCRPNAPNRETVLKLIEEVEQARAVSEVPELGAVRPLPGETTAPPAPPAAPATAVHALPGEALPPPPEALKRPPRPAPTAVPAAATQPAETHAEAPARSHALAWTLLAAAAVATGLAIYGGVRVANWQSQAGRLPTIPAYTSYQNLAAQQPNISNWEVAAFSLAGVAIAGVAAGAATW